MSISQSLLPELDQEMARTRKTLERIPMDRFDWKPHEKSFSLGELANHVSRLLWWGRETMKTESLDLAPEGRELEAPPVVKTTEALLEAFDEGAAAFRRTIEAAGDEDFMFPWTLYRGGQTLFTLPRIAVIRDTILNHIIHHRGQLTVYLRLNDVSVPALYGPSADERS
jgi:uncharacterized damage-inducible protein DinB